MRNRLGAIVLCALLGALGGCATRPPSQPLPRDAAAVVGFALNARVAVKVDDRGYTARLVWRHSALHDSLRLYSPLGSVIGEIEAGDHGATLTTSDKKVYRAADAQSLTREVLGWDLPLAGLRYWVTGRADPAFAVEDEQRDARQRFTSLAQNDWRVAYSEYFDDSALPARLTLTYDRLRLRLIVERWELLP